MPGEVVQLNVIQLAKYALSNKYSLVEEHLEAWLQTNGPTPSPEKWLPNISLDKSRWLVSGALAHLAAKRGDSDTLEKMANTRDIAIMAGLVMPYPYNDKLTPKEHAAGKDRSPAFQALAGVEERALNAATDFYRLHPECAPTGGAAAQSRQAEASPTPPGAPPHYLNILAGAGAASAAASAGTGTGTGAASAGAGTKARTHQP